MKRNVKVLLGILSVVVVQGLASCCKTYQCGPYNTNSFRISNFTPQESDTIIVRAFKKGSGFSQKLDSVLLAKDKNADYHSQEDGMSTEVSFRNDTKFELSSLYDFEFYFPATNTLRRVSEMTDIQGEIECSSPAQKKKCENELGSLRLDGVLIGTGGFSIGFPSLVK